MKRVRGVDEVISPVGTTIKHTSLSGGVISGIGNLGSGASVGLEYHINSGIGTGVNLNQTVRQLTLKEMPGSIQFGTAQTQQQQYPGAIVVSTAAPSPNKIHSNTTPLASTAPSSSLSASNQQQQQQQQQQHQQFQRLKVEDALSYLDQVKLKFNDQPQVYNDFLDIMKEFKSQSIDTPGVITRVSHLFKGHPELIVGFNTFLPPGYKIEVQANEQGYAYQVSVSIPSEQSTHTSSLSHCVNVGSPPIASPPNQQSKAPSVMQIMSSGGNIHHNISSSINKNNMNIHPPSPEPLPSFNNSHVTSAQAQAAVNQALSQVQDGASSNTGTSQNQPVEFNHAINYVNKIKNRFQGQPDKYKRFLEILHTYQKEQRVLKDGGAVASGGGSGGNISVIGGNISCGVGGIPTAASASGSKLTEAEVYAQVAKLFENQEDLLAEFGQFLPDATNSSNSLSAMFQSNKVPANDHAAIVKKQLGSKTTVYNNSNIIPRDHRDVLPSGNLERERDHRDREREREQRERDRERERERERPPQPQLPTTPLSSTATSTIRSGNDLNSGQKFGHTPLQVKRSPSFTSTITTSNSHHHHHQQQSPIQHHQQQQHHHQHQQQQHHQQQQQHHHHQQHQHQHQQQQQQQHHGPPPAKKHKVSVANRDLSISEAGKYGTLNDYAFFDKVRKVLKSTEVYNNFLRCLLIFNNEIISKSELVQLVLPFLGKYPELYKWFKDFLGHLSDSATSGSSGGGGGGVGDVGGVGGSGRISGSSGGGGGIGGNNSTNTSGINIELLSNNVVRSHQDRPQGDLAMEIDYTACKRLGASYCALPKSYVQPKCTGRTQLCREVLNDTWVSFPTWSEDSTFVTSRKTQFEEFIYRCEDERFELDGVIETNAATIRVFEGIAKKMNRFTPDEIQKFKLDDCLGGSSPTIHQRALKRIYGDKAPDIIDGLKKNPFVAVPVVLRRLKSKEEEWREAQKGFNKIWREQNEKYYLKSLDHQGINFKQNDVKALRSKSLFNEIETLYDERHEQVDDSVENQDNNGPHLILPYKDKSVLEDAANLLIHHVKRQTAIHKDDKQRIKLLLKHFIPDLFFHPKQELSDDERDDDDRDYDVGNSQSTSGASTTTLGLHGSRNHLKNKLNASSSGNSSSSTTNNNNNNNNSNNNNMTIKIEDDIKVPIHALSTDPEEAYTLFMGSNNWYLFLRLHHILCERLTKMYDKACALAEEEARYKQQRKESTAVALRLKPKNEIPIENYYPTFLDMIKNVLDGNMESVAFEDTLREMFGIHAYVAFTLDKVVTYAVRQLQHLVTDSICQQCTELFQREQRQPQDNCGAGGLCTTAYIRVGAEMAYQRRAEKTMAEENCFKIYIYKKDCKMTIELLDTEGEETNGGSSERERDEVNAAEKWSSYVEAYSAPSTQTSPKDISSTSPNNETTTTTTTTTTSTNHPMVGNGWNSLPRNLPNQKPLFLSRNIRQWKKHAAKNSRSPNLDDNTRHPEEENEVENILKRSDELRDAVTSDDTQCTFDLSSYRVAFVGSSHSWFYRPNCLHRARKSHVSITISNDAKFHRQHEKWTTAYVSSAQHRLIRDWLMGHYDNVIPHRTQVLNDNDRTRTPYRSYNKYRVEILKNEIESGKQST